jgi:hypothetical protein
MFTIIMVALAWCVCVICFYFISKHSDFEICKGYMYKLCLFQYRLHLPSLVQMSFGIKELINLMTYDEQHNL